MKEKMIVAMHETGHAIVALDKHLQVKEISIHGQTKITLPDKFWYLAPPNSMLQVNKEKIFEDIFEEYCRYYDKYNEEEINELIANETYKERDIKEIFEKLLSLKSKNVSLESILGTRTFGPRILSPLYYFDEYRKEFFDWLSGLKKDVVKCENAIKKFNPYLASLSFHVINEYSSKVMNMIMIDLDKKYSESDFKIAETMLPIYNAGYRIDGLSDDIIILIDVSLAGWAATNFPL